MKNKVLIQGLAELLGVHIEYHTHLRALNRKLCG